MASWLDDLDFDFTRLDTSEQTELRHRRTKVLIVVIEKDLSHLLRAFHILAH